MNLPYSAESTETGTAGDTVSVVLRERLNSSTVYYYTVSAVSGDVTAVVQAGNFTTQYSEYSLRGYLICMGVQIIEVGITNIASMNSMFGLVGYVLQNLTYINLQLVEMLLWYSASSTLYLSSVY